MSLVFFILIVEVAAVSLLLLPLPQKVQNVIVGKYDELLGNSNFAIVLSFLDVLISVLFVDSFKNGFGMLGKGDDIVEFSKNVWDTRSKKFYAQRNLYILGAILALQVCAWFIIILLKSSVKNKEKLVKLSKIGSTNADCDKLKDDISKAELDIQTLNKQYDSLWEAYKAKDANVKESVTEKKDK